ncbi:MAG: tripartite tricarboxylate transporter TctB family protein [Selenomonadales bacterium]|nr:tripartite tricarboxylate transporter TctB family protein [Selenomonadales bacterium]
MLLELLFNAGLVALFTYAYFFIGASVPAAPGPGWGAQVWPQAILLMLIFLLCVNMYQVYRKGAGTQANELAELRRLSLAALVQSKLSLAMLSLFVYAMSLQAAGFILSTLVFFMVYAKIVGQKSAKLLVLSSFIATFAVYFVFSRALGVMLPRGVGILRDFAIFLESL